MRRHGQWVEYTRREMEAMGEPVGMPDRGPAFGERLDPLSAVAVVGSSLIGGSMQSRAAGKAADAQRDSTAASIAEQQRQYDLTREDYAPYREAGYNALSQLQRDINAPVTQADVMRDPGYQFGLQQGQQALDRKIAAMGGRVSGAALKAAARYGTDYASTGYNAAYQRRQDRLNRLAALAGVGQTATGSSAAAGANATNAISALRQGNAETQGAAGMAQANIWGNTGNQLAALFARRPKSTGGGWSSGLEGMSPDDLSNFYG